MPRMVTCDAFDSTKRESTTPKGVASTLHLPPRVASYRRQPWAIESTTPMGLPYHCPFMTTTTTGTRIILRWSCTHHCPFITTTTMGTRITLRWDCLPHEHSSPRHGIGMVSDTSIYYNSITRGVPMPPQGVAHRMAINYQTHAIEVVRITPIYHRATTWDCVPHGHSLPSHAIGMVRTTPLYYHIITRRVSYHSVELRAASSFITKI